MPALDDEYAAALAAMIFPATDEMLTMLPPLALLGDGPPERPAHVEGAVEVRVDDGPPELDVEVDHGNPVRAAGRARVVHDDVDSPEGAEHLPEQLVDRLGVGHVADHRQRAPAERPHLLGHRVDVVPAGFLLVVRVPLRSAPGAGEHHVTAGPGQLHGDRPPDRAHPAGARNHGDLAF